MKARRDKSLSDTDFSQGNTLENGSWVSPDLGEPKYNYDKGAFDQPEKTVVANDETPDITGKKLFNDYGTRLAPQSIEQVQNLVKLTVQRSVDGQS